MSAMPCWIATCPTGSFHADVTYARRDGTTAAPPVLSAHAESDRAVRFFRVFVPETNQGFADFVARTGFKNPVAHVLNLNCTLDFSGMEAVLQAGVEHIFNEDPPAARLELGYDPFLANPRGRSYRPGATVTC